MVTTLVLALLMAPPTGDVGRVVAASGEVSLTRDNTATPVDRGAYLLAGDVVKTGADGRVRMLMRDKSVLALPARSSIRIPAYDVDGKTRRRRARLTVIVGRLWALVTKTVNPEASYEVATENAVAGVRGTELVFDANSDGSSAVTVIHGEVDLASGGRAETLGAREQGVATDTIALRSANEETIADLRDEVRPEQELDTAKADKRLAAAREKEDDGPAGRQLTDDQEVERDDPGTGDSVFEDAGAASPDPDGSYDNRGPPTGGGWFDPSTMARVRVRVEVRP